MSLVGTLVHRRFATLHIVRLIKQEREEQGVDLLTRIQTGASFPQPAVDHRVPARAALLARPLLLRATR